MSKTISSSMPSAGRIFTKETLNKGKSAQIECIEIGGQTFSIIRGSFAVIRLEDEWYEDVDDPQAVISALEANTAFKPDFFTFWQRIPEVEPQYLFHQEWENIAVLPITSYEHWWNHQIKSRIRNLIRKAEKAGVVVKETSYDDDFIRGMTAIFNEAPVRQGRRFWHYGKDFETIKSQFSRYLFREQMIGAYYRDELIGFMMLGDAGRYGITGQIISSIKHRDKAPNNALIAKAVEVCEQRKLDYLIYLFWSDDSLAEFKRRCGFVKMSVPRYFIPLTWKGKLALQCGIHHGWNKMLPAWIKNPLKRLRKRWYEFQTQ